MRFIVTVLVLSLICVGGAFAQHFESVPATGDMSYPIVVTAATINGVSLMEGDEIAVFDDDLCVGAVVIEDDFPGNAVNVPSWQEYIDEELGINLPGFIAGNQILFKLWDASAEFEIDLGADGVTYVTGNGTFDFGNFSIVTIAAEVAGLTIEGTITECTDDGPAIEDVSVFLEGTLVTQTDANGFYSIDNAQMGANTITFEHTEHYPTDIVVNITEPGVAVGDAVMMYPDVNVLTPQPVQIEVMGDFVAQGGIQIEATGCAHEYRYAAEIVDVDQRDWITLNPTNGFVPAGDNITRWINIIVDLTEPPFELVDGDVIDVEVRLIGDYAAEDEIIEASVTLNIYDTLSGIVLECEEDGPPLEGVEVFLNEEDVARTTTDANGAFEITNAPTGPGNTVIFMEPYHLDVTVRNVEVPNDMGIITMRGPHAAIELDTLDIVISGADTTGSGVFELSNIGCSTLYWVASPQDPADEWITFNPPSGQIIRGLDQNITVLVDMTHESFDPDDIVDGAEIFATIQVNGQVNHEIGENPTLVLRHFLLLSAGIDGVVRECTEDGAPIEGVEVFVNDEAEPRTTTDVNGAYTLDVAQGAIYDLRFEHCAYYTVNEDNVMAPNVTDIVMYKPDASVPTETLEVIVNGVDYEGSVDFDLVSIGCANLDWIATVAVDSQRTFVSIDPNQGRLPVNETRTLTANVNMMGMQGLHHLQEIPVDIEFTGEFWCEPPTVHLNLVLHTEGELSGHITECTNDGAPIEGVEVYLNNNDEPSAVTDENGDYVTNDVSMGQNYNVRFEHPWYYPRQMNNIRINAEGTTTLNTTLYNPSAHLETTWILLPVQIQYFACDSTGSTEFELIHDGCADLDWTAALVDENVDYLTFGPAEGTLDVGETETFTVNVDLRGEPFPLEDGAIHEVRIQFAGEHWERPARATIAIQTVLSVNGENAERPTEYSLSQNYPNPFNPVTEITYSLLEQQNVTLSVFNLMGQEVARLVEGAVPAGIHTVSFDATNLPTGIYFYRIDSPAFKANKKMLFVK